MKRYWTQCLWSHDGNFASRYDVKALTTIRFSIRTRMHLWFCFPLLPQMLAETSFFFVPASTSSRTFGLPVFHFRRFLMLLKPGVWMIIKVTIGLSSHCRDFRVSRGLVLALVFHAAASAGQSSSLGWTDQRELTGLGDCNGEDIGGSFLRTVLADSKVQSVMRKEMKSKRGIILATKPPPGTSLSNFTNLSILRSVRQSSKSCPMTVRTGDFQEKISSLTAENDRVGTSRPEVNPFMIIDKRETLNQQIWLSGPEKSIKRLTPQTSLTLLA